MYYRYTVDVKEEFHVFKACLSNLLKVPTDLTEPQRSPYHERSKNDPEHPSRTPLSHLTGTAGPFFYELLSCYGYISFVNH